MILGSFFDVLALGNNLSLNSILKQIEYKNLIDDKSTKMMISAILDSNYKGIDKENSNKIRAKQLKQMLLAYID